MKMKNQKEKGRKKKMDNCILDNICKFISDPNTYYNFCLANKKTSYIGNLWSERKMKEFSRSNKYEISANGDSVSYVDNKLPNGMRHGVCYNYTSHPGDPDILNQIYYKEFLLGYWLQYDGKEKITINYEPYYIDKLKENYKVYCFVEGYLNELLGSKGYKREDPEKSLALPKLRKEYWCLLK